MVRTLPLFFFQIKFLPIIPTLLFYATLYYTIVIGRCSTTFPDTSTAVRIATPSYAGTVLSAFTTHTN